MTTDTNPYQAPAETEMVEDGPPRFENWSHSRLVVLFFIPSFILGLSLISTRITHHFIFGGVGLAILASIGVSVLSAHIHTVRQESHWGTFTLFSFVYLLAQTFALMLCTATLWILVTSFQ